MRKLFAIAVAAEVIAKQYKYAALVALFKRVAAVAVFGEGEWELLLVLRSRLARHVRHADTVPIPSETNRGSAALDRRCRNRTRTSSLHARPILVR